MLLFVYLDILKKELWLPNKKSMNQHSLIIHTFLICLTYINLYHLNNKINLIIQLFFLP